MNYAATTAVGADVLFALRSGSGSFRIDSAALTSAERHAIDVSWRAHGSDVARSARSFFGRRIDRQQVVDAADWLVSETYTYAIAQAVSGVAPIPETRREWLRIVNLLRRRWWRERPDARGECRDTEQLAEVATWESFGASLGAASVTLTHSGMVELMRRWAIAGSPSGRITESAIRIIEAMAEYGVDAPAAVLAEESSKNRAWRPEVTPESADMARRRIIDRMRAGWLCDVIGL